MTWLLVGSLVLRHLIDGRERCIEITQCGRGRSINGCRAFDAVVYPKGWKIGGKIRLIRAKWRTPAQPEIETRQYEKIHGHRGTATDSWAQVKCTVSVVAAAVSPVALKWARRMGGSGHPR